MSALTVVGGLYRERCVWPDWNQVFGSGGRAASALVSHIDAVAFRTYASAAAAAQFRLQADIDNLEFYSQPVEQFISFDYLHSLSTPMITPPHWQVAEHDPIDVCAEVVLRFGMLEGTARVTAKRCVYDPQSAFRPEPFSENGSYAERLAIVGNRREICTLGRSPDLADASNRLLDEGAEIVVVKCGVEGAQVVTASETVSVPPNRARHVWSIGSGDVFAAVFAARWAVHGDRPEDAAALASAAVAVYADTMALPAPSPEALRAGAVPTRACGGQAYLAGPFFTMSQRWLVDEVYRGLQEVGFQVFSPFHDVGLGPASDVTPADIGGLQASDIVFALLDGLDSGTLFEVGYARAIEKPVYAFAQSASTQDLKMVEGSGCRVYTDLVTALHHAAWRV